jgi:Coenzyme PQQ synthesis protein D (PqqD)
MPGGNSILVMPDPFTATVRISDDAISQEVGGETVILDLQGESYFGLDQTGTRIWQLLAQYRELQRVFEMMLEEYEVEPQILRNDLQTLVDRLSDAGLLVVEG